jgi:MFS family permease
MMSVGLLGLGCALLSAAGVAILAAIDPKRRRDARRAPRSGLRWLLVLAIFIPGAVLGVAGRWSDFLIWVGAAAVLGWGIAALFNVLRERPKPDAPRQSEPPS